GRVGSPSPGAGSPLVPPAASSSPAAPSRPRASPLIASPQLRTVPRVHVRGIAPPCPRGPALAHGTPVRDLRAACTERALGRRRTCHGGPAAGARPGGRSPAPQEAPPEPLEHARAAPDLLRLDPFVDRMCLRDRSGAEADGRRAALVEERGIDPGAHPLDAG